MLNEEVIAGTPSIPFWSIYSPELYSRSSGQNGGQIIDISPMGGAAARLPYMEEQISTPDEQRIADDLPEMTIADIGSR
ncbi:hypothetical protein LNP74_05170 [Klebsiella pneumoniae subsp. pneumoniae]|nr:hypothetical protein [Klebsiella pneumoniae subsp. pneumoniae]